MAQSNRQKKILFRILVLVTFINTANSQQESEHVALFKPEYEKMPLDLFFTNESAVLRCNHEPGEQVDIHRPLSANPGDYDCLVKNSTVNEIHKEQLRVEDNEYHLDLIVYDVENFNGSQLQCIPRVHTSPRSLKIFVATSSSLIGINSTSYSLKTRDGVVIESAKCCGCSFVIEEQTRTSAIGHCKSGMNESCSGFINVTLSLPNQDNVILGKREVSVGPVCSIDDLIEEKSNVTMPTMEDNLDKDMIDYTEDDHDGGGSKAMAKLPGGYIMLIPVVVCICQLYQ